MTPRAPLQPWLHELAVCVRGNVTVLGDWGGDITGDGAQGLWVDDRRVLSQLRIRVDGEPVARVGWHATGSTARFLGSARTLAPATPDPAVEIHRHRSLGAHGLTELVAVTARTLDDVEVELEITLAGDDATISSAKSGWVESGLLPATAPMPRQSAPGASADPRPTPLAVMQGSSHRVTIEITPAPDEVVLTDQGVRVRFRVTVPGGATCQIRLGVVASRTAASDFEADPGCDRIDWSQVRVEATDPRIGQVIAAGLADLHALLLSDPRDPRDVFAAAGTPWYLTLFGRDSIWTALLTLPIGTDLAAGTLRALARRQGRRLDPATGQEPGKIPHELRRFNLHDPVSGLALPSVYFGTVDATALWVILLDEARRWGLADGVVTGLLPSLEAALTWLVEHSMPEADGLLKYYDASGSGLANQGWKDSGDAIRFRDGRIAEGPIALVEAQAYAAHALRVGGDLLAAYGIGDGAAQRAAAEQLAERLRDRFWVDAPTGRYLGLAIDRSGTLVDGLGSNMGHVLGRGLLDDKEIDAITAALTGPELLDDFGLRTLGNRNGGYNPLGYHTGAIWTHDTAIAALGLARDGRTRQAVALCRGLLRSAAAFDYRWPELYAGADTLGRPVAYPAACRPQAWSAASCIALLTVLLGLRPDAQRGTLTLTPVRPAPFGAMRVRGLRFLGGAVDLDVDPDGAITILAQPPGAQVRVT